MLSVPFQEIPEIQKINPVFQNALSHYNKISSHKKPIINLGNFTVLVVLVFVLVLITKKISDRK